MGNGLGPVGHQSTISRRTVLAGLGAGILLPAPTFAAPNKTLTLMRAARRQLGVTIGYDPQYVRLPFPNGDVPRRVGVCTDVIIRAYRDAFGIDLQSLVNADMKMAFAAYPKLWGLRRPDSNIDHRRVPNLQRFFERKGAKLLIPRGPHQWRPGDIFTAMIGGRLPHIGFISDKELRLGSPFVIHNIGAGAREEDALQNFSVTGRYRFLLER